MLASAVFDGLDRSPRTSIQLARPAFGVQTPATSTVRGAPQPDAPRAARCVAAYRKAVVVALWAPGTLTVTDSPPWPRPCLADSRAVTAPRRSDPTPLAIVLP